MKNESHETNICPYCGKAYTARPALSRKDGKTLICPDWRYKRNPHGTWDRLGGAGKDFGSDSQKLLLIEKTKALCYY